MRWLLAITLAAAPISVQAQSLWDYAWTPDGNVTADGHGFSIYVHPKQDIILVQIHMAELFHGEPKLWPVETWRHAAEAFATPIGCGISEVHVHGPKAGASWEATYVCPPGVDLRTLAKAQHADLMRGLPLHR